MPYTVYEDLDDLTELQKSVMEVITKWVRENKTPVPRKEIIVTMKENGMNKPTVVYCLEALLNRGYIRRAFTMSNTTQFVQIRTI